MFPQLDSIVYLDNAGATLPSKQQLAAATDELLSTPFANPHSVGPAASLSASAIEQVKRDILETLFNVSTKEYHLVFTSGATAAMKMVGELFPWQNGGQFLYIRQSHNSLVGIREYAKAKGASFEAYDEEILGNRTLPRRFRKRQTGRIPEGPCLFAVPGECNFSGAKFDTSNALGNTATYFGEHTSRPTSEDENRQWYTLLDASKLVATSAVDLRHIAPDFVCASFYKVFGFPTGMSMPSLLFTGTISVCAQFNSS